MRTREEGRVPLSQGCFPELCWNSRGVKRERTWRAWEELGWGLHKLTSRSIPAAARGIVQKLENRRVARPAQPRCATETDIPCVPGAILRQSRVKFRVSRPGYWGTQGGNTTRGFIMLSVFPNSTAGKDAWRIVATAKFWPESDPCIWVKQSDNILLLTLSTVDFLISTRCRQQLLLLLLLLSFSRTFLPG